MTDEQDSVVVDSDNNLLLRVVDCLEVTHSRPRLLEEEVRLSLLFL
jgi:hypothetical protein